MIWDIIHGIDILLWLFMAGSVVYVLIFSLASLLPKRDRSQKESETKEHSFLVLFPAYHEDAVILHSIHEFLRQDYLKEKYTVAVISDQMKDETNKQLEALPVQLLTPSFEKSSKAKALQYAVRQVEGLFDHVIILDADNIVSPDFLSQLNKSCQKGYKAIQCHRCAKNSDNDIAVLDGISEEINNTLFRRAHNNIGLSSALIGSGMCFDYEWFKANVDHLLTAVEDRELEALLLKQDIYIQYEQDIHVLDEKVSNKENFQRQRLRWMTGQIQSLFSMMPYIPKAIATGNINYIDKTIQQALIPRSMLIVGLLFMSILMSVLVPVWCPKWWSLFICLCISLFIAIPSQLRTRAIFGKIIILPSLAWRMTRNILHIDRKSKEFLHTEHTNESSKISRS